MSTLTLTKEILRDQKPKAKMLWPWSAINQLALLAYLGKISHGGEGLKNNHKPSLKDTWNTDASVLNIVLLNSGVPCVVRGLPGIQLSITNRTHAKNSCSLVQTKTD